MTDTQYSHLADPADEKDTGELPPFSWKKLFAFAGPGWLMSIAYLDPGNIEADLQEGIVGGQSLNWVLMWATIMGLLLQILSARLGAVTGSHLAVVARQQYPPVPRYLLWFMMEIAIVGSDIQEVIGTAIALYILSNGYIPLAWGVVITAFDTFFFFCIERAGVTKLEAFFAFLISIMAISFFTIFAYSGPPFLEIMEGVVVPRLNNETVLPAVGIVGAVIMPHNIYLHSALVATNRPLHRHGRATSSQIRDANRYLAIEAAGALLVSFVINLAVVSAFAQKFYHANPSRPYEVDVSAQCQVNRIAQPNVVVKQNVTCVNIGLAEADGALEAAFGSAARYVWAVGILAAGQSSTMTGTYAGQFVMEGFTGLQMSKWKRTAITRCVAIVPAILVASTVGSNGSEELSLLNQWLNVIQSVQLPFALVPVLKYTNSSEIMGPFRNGRILSSITWVLAVLILSINIYLVFSADALTTPAMQSVGGWVFKIFCTLVYLAFVGYIAFKKVSPFDLSLSESQDPDYEIDVDVNALLGSNSSTPRRLSKMSVASETAVEEPEGTL